MGVQDIHGLAAQEPAQGQDSRNGSAAAKGSGDDGEPGLPGPLRQLSPGVESQDYGMSPPGHDLRFGKDSPFLAAPAQGGLGMDDGKGSLGGRPGD